jgi:DNA-binding transcriptional regulator YiaG
MAKSFQELRARMSPAAQQAAARKTEALLATMPLQQLRQERQMSQEQLAEILHVRQANVSKIERRENVYVNTLRTYVEALGGELEIIARFSDREIKIG